MYAWRFAVKLSKPFNDQSATLEWSTSASIIKGFKSNKVATTMTGHWTVTLPISTIAKCNWRGPFTFTQGRSCNWYNLSKKPLRPILTQHITTIMSCVLDKGHHALLWEGAIWQKKMFTKIFPASLLEYFLKWRYCAHLCCKRILRTDREQFLWCLSSETKTLWHFLAGACL